jgi:hypothetical protein
MSADTVVPVLVVIVFVVFGVGLFGAQLYAGGGPRRP